MEEALWPTQKPCAMGTGALSPELEADYSSPHRWIQRLGELLV
jgi:hypothetical protein